MRYNIVAPLVGAWIEINALYKSSPDSPVAPLVGAWIEIIRDRRELLAVRVAPLVGAWIEIHACQDELSRQTSRSPCGSVD